MPYFFYGTLMDKDVLEIVAGKKVLEKFISEGCLLGHERVYLKNLSYPALITASQSSVRGVLYDGLDEYEVAKIMHFEGNQMILKSLPIVVQTGESTGQSQLAEVFYGEFGKELTDHIWSLEKWMKDEKAEYLRLARVWMQYFGKSNQPNWEDL